MRFWGDKITTMKEVFEGSKGCKYMQQIREDSSKLISKASEVFRKIEKVLLEKIDDESTIYALAKTYDGVLAEFCEVMDWASKLKLVKDAKRQKTK
jgi:hypothetical protein